MAADSGKLPSFALLINGRCQRVATGIQVSQLLPYRVGNSFGNYHVYILPQNRWVSPSFLRGVLLSYIHVEGAYTSSKAVH